MVWGFPRRCPYSNKSPRNPKIARRARAKCRPEREAGMDKAVGSIAIWAAFGNIAKTVAIASLKIYKNNRYEDKGQMQKSKIERLWFCHTLATH
jgi:hypothetical protein